MTIKTKFNVNNNGLSDIVGVIIVVAIIVVLAAIIASTSFHLQSYAVAITAYKLDDNTIIINNVGGQDNDKLLNDTPFIITINDINCTYYGAVPADIDIKVDPSGDENHWSLGKKAYSSVTLKGTALSQSNGNVHVVVVGNFAGGSKIVVLDTEV